MNRLLIPGIFALVMIGAAFLGNQSPQPAPQPSAGSELEAAVPQLERIIGQFLTRVRGHNAPLPITEVEARRIEAMLGALNMEVPRGALPSGGSVSEVARTAAGRLTPAQLAQLPGLAPGGESPRRALPVPGGPEPERRSAELRLNGTPLDAEAAKTVQIKPGDRLEAKGAVYYPVKIGDALVEFRDESRVTVRPDELFLDEGQILLRTQEGLTPASPSAGASPGAVAASPAASAAPSAAASIAPLAPEAVRASVGPLPSVAPLPEVVQTVPSAVPSGSPAPVEIRRLSGLLAPSASPGTPLPNTTGRFRVGTPHAEMIDIGTAWVATAEKRRSRAEVLLGKVLMKSKKTGQWIELNPGEFAWTEDDGTLLKRNFELLRPAASAAPQASPGASGALGPGPPPTPDPAQESSLISSGDLPKPSPQPSASGVPFPTPSPSASASPDASPSQSPPPSFQQPTPVPQVDQRNNPTFQGGFGNQTPTVTPAVTPTAVPVTPTPAPADTQ